MSTTIVSQAERDYVNSTPRSRALYEDACEVMPGGTTRTTVYFSPYPLYVERGDGCRIWDADGTERIDFIGNYSAMILGHAHPAVVAAVSEQIRRGSAFAAANPYEVELAKELCNRIQAMDQVRFTNCGTEATMYAMRLARAATGRTKLARFEGGYHGTHDYAEVSTKPVPLDRAGPPRQPAAVPDSIGTPAVALAETVVLPYNDAEGTEQILRMHGSELAAVIVEPVLGAGGAIPAEPEFLRHLRRVTSDLGILLIFDEVISFRIARGGAQKYFGVEPDLTTLGKVIGGGLPVAAFGGRADIMALLDPRREANLPQGGTYNGHPLGMVAGLATLRGLVPDVYRDLSAKGDEVRRRLTRAFAEYGVAAQVTGIASLFNIHFTATPVRDHRSMRTGDVSRLRELFLGLLNRGILLAPRGMGALSTPMGEQEIDHLIDAVDDVVREHRDAWTG